MTAANLRPAFPQGLFIAQDGNNDNRNQNFRLVPWQTIAAAIGQTSSKQHPAPAFVGRRSRAAAPTSTDALLPITLVSCS